MRRFINIEDLEAMEFIKMPSAIIYDKKYKAIKAEGKILYSILLNLLKLSIKNGLINKEGIPYVRISRSKIGEFLNISGPSTLAKVVRELRDYGLIEEKTNTIERCNEIYLYIIEEFTRDTNFNFRRGRTFSNEGKEKFIENNSKVSENQLNIINEELICTLDHGEEGTSKIEGEEVKIDEVASKSDGNEISGNKTTSKNEGIELQKVNFETFKNCSHIRSKDKKNELRKNNNSTTLNNYSNNLENYITTENEPVRNSKFEVVHENKSIDSNFEGQLRNDKNFKKLFNIQLKEEENYKERLRGKIAHEAEHKVNLKEVKGFEKTEEETVREIYRDYYLTDGEVNSLLKAAERNLYIIDLAHEQSLENVHNIRNFVAYNIAIIKNIK